MSIRTRSKRLKLSPDTSTRADASYDTTSDSDSSLGGSEAVAWIGAGGAGGGDVAPYASDSDSDSESCSHLAPFSIHARAIAALDPKAGVYDDSLSLDSVPMAREEQYERLLKVYRSWSEDGDGDTNCSVYVCGPTGVGKTHCVSYLRRLAESEGWTVKFINATDKVKNVQDLFGQLTGAGAGAGALKSWSPRKSNPRRDSEGIGKGNGKYRGKDKDRGRGNAKQEQEQESRTLLVVDEADHLKAADADALFHPPRGVAVVGIGNHALSDSTGKGVPRVDFKAYTYLDGLNILRSRVGNLELEIESGERIPLFEDKALELCCRRLQKEWRGDIRKALPMCAAAVRLVLDEMDMDMESDVDGDGDGEGDDVSESRRAVTCTGQVEVRHMNQVCSGTQKSNDGGLVILQKLILKAFCETLPAASASGSARVAELDLLKTCRKYKYGNRDDLKGALRILPSSYLIDGQSKKLGKFWEAVMPVVDIRDMLSHDPELIRYGGQEKD